MDSPKRLPSPENRPENKSPEHRLPSKPPSPAISAKPVQEVPSLPLPSPTVTSKPVQEVPSLPPSSSPTVVTRPIPSLPPPPPPEWEEAVVVNQSKHEETGAVTKVEGGAGRGRAISSILRRSRRDPMVQKVGLGFRIMGLVFCLLSFSVMAADKTQGWAGDSFERYKEYRYCISMTVIGFVYSAFQAYVQTHHLMTGKHIIRHPMRYYFDFAMDQILAYLLMSASSSAATRTDSWVSNWGEDEFTKMASASIGMSFLAFFAFAFSSLISGYILCNRN